MFIPDPNCSIPDPGSRGKKIPDPGSASKNLSIFLTQKNVCKLSDIGNEFQYPSCKIPDPDFAIPDRGSKRHRIADPDSQHSINKEFKYFQP